MATLRELGPDETALVYVAMRELRPHLPSPMEFVARVNASQRPEGYRLLAAFAPDVPDAVAVAGFRTLHTLAWGHVLYVDDLITRPAYRSQGHADALLLWLLEEARRLGCEQFHLDSGVQRFDAHRFYFAHRMRISAYHFQIDLA